MIEVSSDRDVPPPDRAPGARSEERFRRGLTHPFVWAFLGAPVLAALVLFGFMVPVWPVALLIVLAISAAAIWSFRQAFRESRRR